MSELTYTTYKDLVRDTMELLPRIVMSGIDGIMGIPRSGMTPAAIIATELSLPLTQVRNDWTERQFSQGNRMGAGWNPVRKVLIVDDSLYQGTAMKAAKSIVSGLDMPYLTCVVYMQPGQEKQVHIFNKVIGSPRCFEWNLWNSWVTKKGVFDMDGVICHDPAVFDDDGPRYQHALENAVLKHRPIRPFMILTHRIERWRKVTEDWLALHGIVPQHLIMAPFDSAEERRNHLPIRSGMWKSQWYHDSDAKVMIESHDKWASRIRDHTRKPVISLESNQVFR